MRATIAQYYPTDSLIHRLDPRAKIVATVALAVSLFVVNSFASLGVFAGLAVAAIALSHVPASWFWRGLKPALWLVAFTLVAQVLLVPGKTFLKLGPLHFSWRGLELAGYLSLRLVVLVLLASLLPLTTSPIALTDGLAWLGRPLRRLRLPTEELAVMVTIALRFIPTLLAELEAIMRAQRARGADFSHGGPLRRARALVPVLVPLFVISFRRADDLALAMEARCFVPGARRTRLYPLRTGVADWATLLVVASTTAGALVLGAMV